MRQAREYPMLPKPNHFPTIQIHSNASASPQA